MLQCCVCHLSVTLCIVAKRCVIEQKLLTVHRPRAYIILHNGNWPIAYWQKNHCRLKETNWFWITSLRFHRDFIRLLWSSWHVSPVNFSYSEALFENLWWNLQIPWPWKVIFADACSARTNWTVRWHNFYFMTILERPQTAISHDKGPIPPPPLNRDGVTSYCCQSTSQNNIGL